MKLYRVIAGLTVVATVTLTACHSTGAPWKSAGAAGPSDASSTTAAIKGPVDGATGVPASVEITFETAHAKSTTIDLVDTTTGRNVDGALRDDGSSWVPAQALRYSTRYTAKLTATGLTGHGVSSSVSFTTMSKPANTVAMHSWVGDNQVYGVGIPLVLTFEKAVPDDRRATVQRRLFVSTNPPQEGAWSWFSPTEVHYRPRGYWKTGTTFSLRALFGGLPLGNGAYGGNDLTVDASVTPSDLRIVVDDKTKTLTVTQDGNVIKSIPASLGKASTPSSSGNMVIMSRAEQEIFDSSTNGVPANSPGGYRETVYYPLRLTWDGQYIHAAPWSVGAQGSYDVSHGCTNISMDNAKWLYGIVHVGDPVTVRNTSTPLQWGDGWTDWDRGWEDFVKGSAIPYTPPSAAPSPSTS